MTIPFLTTVIGSMPKPAWLYEQVAFNAKDQDHHGSGADWGFAGELLRQAQDDAVVPSTAPIDDGDTPVRHDDVLVESARDVPGDELPVAGDERPERRVRLDFAIIHRLHDAFSVFTPQFVQM